MVGLPEVTVVFSSGWLKANTAQLLAAAENGDTGFSEWEYDVTFKGAPRTIMSQVDVRRWKDGKVIHERFYYGDAHSPADEAASTNSTPISRLVTNRNADRGLIP